LPCISIACATEGEDIRHYGTIPNHFAALDSVARKLVGMYKAPPARESAGPNPTDRRKKRSKRHILVDGRGVPLSLVVTGANRHDVSQLKPVLEQKITEPSGMTPLGRRNHRVKKS
jgi:hypothetical protein